MLEFIEWNVQGNQHVVVFLHNGEVIRGKAWAFQKNILRIKSEEVIHNINIEEISDIFSIRKAEGIEN
ncbi:hypothetical protein LBW89_01750 [Paenibacillus sp. alder61]|uniref:hypothetical protein n=1 Tax=Paenibacillus sp. alder61 TaxID=2862948 RepID=UPI001CD3C76A|nr:hypothetical protein [Paenibacillus sp. alder61]MCA1291734.1 hypothetical protein [Paenibacillus sp. alder61]